MKKSTQVNDIGRNWTFLIYPDSCKENYRDILNGLHIQWVESPLHDQDIRANGENKKPHIHVVLCFEGNKSYSQICDIANSVNGVIAPLDSPEDCPRVNSIRGMVRYLIHIDDPDKHQYERDKIITHGGMDIEQYFTYAQAIVKRIIMEMMTFCDAMSIYEFSDLLDYALNNRYDDWYDLLTVGHQAWIIKTYIDSRRYKASEQVKMQYYIENKISKKGKKKNGNS